MPRLLAATYDRCIAATEAAGLADWRRDLLQELAGEVLEVGAGTGHNLRWYPDAVTRLLITEPDPYMRRRLQQKVGDREAQVLDAGVDPLPFPDRSFDAVVATLVLCSVPDPAAALAEIRRVLRPDGRFVYIEHVAAVDRPNRLKWQRRVEPIWKRFAGNCHLTRSTDVTMAEAGFVVETERRQSLPKSPPWVRPSIRGVARPQGSSRTEG